MTDDGGAGPVELQGGIHGSQSVAAESLQSAAEGEVGRRNIIRHDIILPGVENPLGQTAERYCLITGKVGRIGAAALLGKVHPVGKDRRMVAGGEGASVHADGTASEGSILQRGAGFIQNKSAGNQAHAARRIACEGAVVR